MEFKFNLLVRLASIIHKNKNKNLNVQYFILTIIMNAIIKIGLK